MAQAPHVPTDETKMEVMIGVCIGTPHKAIAQIIGISYDTLLKYYGDLIENGRALLIQRVAGQLVSTALAGQASPNVTAMLFFLKTQGRWKENHETEVDNTIEVIGGLPVQDLK